MICEVVTRNDIRSIKAGQVGIFTLPNQGAKEAARVQFSTVKRLSEGKYDYERVDEDELRNMLGKDFETIIPDWSRTIAYRCTKNELS